jgi:glycosyltransferase involved in cell wall biosynthesis
MSTPTLIDVSVIVPAYNVEGTIAQCIESVLAQKTREQFELIVVDDGSIDNTAGVAARYEGVRVLRQVNSGAGVARNLGAREARGDVLCFIDADCVATPGWLDALLGAIRAGADGVKGALLTNQSELIARFTQVEYEDKYDRMRRRDRIDFIDMGSAAYRRDVMLGLGEGGFDTRYPGASVEDQELSFRLAKLGCDLRFVPEAVVYHRHPTTLRAYARRKFNIGRWKVLVHVRHPERIVSDSHTPTSLKAQLVLFWGIMGSLALTPFHRRATRVCRQLMAVFLISTIPFVLKAARKDPQVALLSPAMLLVRAASLGVGVAVGGWRLVKRDA